MKDSETFLSGTANEKFHQAWKLSQEFWFPANPKVVSGLKDQLRSGSLNKETLLREIRSDTSLFLYCLRELAKGLEERPPLHPFDLFRIASREQLTTILDGANNRLSAHRLETISTVQGMRFQESLISATVSEVLCEEGRLDPEVGFSTGILRQLGHTLIAWNYPHIYEREILNLKDKDSLDNRLRKTLGFAPALFGVAAARKWNLLPEVRHAVGDKTALKTLPKAQAAAITFAAQDLQKICEVGEALARANHGDHYPSAREDWQKARKAIESRVGLQGMRVIQQRVSESCEKYLAYIPEQFKSSLEERLESHLQALGGKTLFQNNRNIQACQPNVQLQLKELYGRIEADSISKENVRVLTSKIVPATGFLQGCVYSFDPTTMTLVPQLAIASSDLSHFSAIDCSPLADMKNQIVEAFHSDQPIIIQNTWDQNKHFTIAAVFGLIQRAGVLYLEAPSETTKDKNLNLCAIFQALNQTLMDCLKLH